MTIPPSSGATTSTWCTLCVLELFMKRGADSLYRNSFSFSDEKLNSPSVSAPSLPSPSVTPCKAKLGDTKELEDFIADLDRTLASMWNESLALCLPANVFWRISDTCHWELLPLSDNFATQDIYPLNITFGNSYKYLTGNISLVTLQQMELYNLSVTAVFCFKI